MVNTDFAILIVYLSLFISQWSQVGIPPPLSFPPVPLLCYYIKFKNENENQFSFPQIYQNMLAVSIFWGLVLSWHFLYQLKF